MGTFYPEFLCLFMYFGFIFYTYPPLGEKVPISSEGTEKTENEEK